VKNFDKRPLAIVAKKSYAGVKIVAKQSTTDTFAFAFAFVFAFAVADCFATILTPEQSFLAMSRSFIEILRSLVSTFVLH